MGMRDRKGSAPGMGTVSANRYGNDGLRPTLRMADLPTDGSRNAPERRCSSRTFRYGYLVTT